MLTKIADQIWEAQVDLEMMGSWIVFPCRMTIIRLADGALMLHSPIGIDDALARDIAALGEVRYLVAPNCFHHLYLTKVMARYPEAELYTAPGLAQKRPDLDVTAEIRPDKHLPWAEEFTWFTLAGAPKMNEVIMLHKRSKTLIVTDLIFNMYEVRGVLTPWLLRCAGVWRKPGQSRVWRILTADRGKAKSSLKPVFQEDFERIVMAHGEVIDQDVKAVLNRSLAWMTA